MDVVTHVCHGRDRFYSTMLNAEISPSFRMKR
jgi:hypothetical protein